MRNRLKRHGFTLIELLVVLAMIASVSALVGPSLFRQLDNIKANSEQRQIINLIDKLGQKAFLSNSIIDVTFKGHNVEYGYRGDAKPTIKRRFSVVDCQRQSLTLNKLGFLEKTVLECVANGRNIRISLREVNQL